MKIVVTGGGGLVGSHFVESARTRSDLEIVAPSSQELDITSGNDVARFVRHESPDAVVHYAAFTDVNAAENQRDDKQGSAWKINVDGAFHAAFAAHDANAFFIHVSTDMVFSGRPDNPGPYGEDAMIEADPAKLSWYGWTKAEAERNVMRVGGNYAIVRIAYPARAHFDAKLDHVRKLLKLYDDGKLYPLFDDQHLTMTLVDDVSLAVTKILESHSTGMFHISSTDRYTPFDLAQYLLKQARNADNVVTRSSIKDFLAKQPNPSRYAQFGGLNTDQTQSTVGINLRSWREEIDELLKQGMK